VAGKKQGPKRSLEAKSKMTQTSLTDGSKTENDNAANSHFKKSLSSM
jgi:hypothetical protein